MRVQTERATDWDNSDATDGDSDATGINADKTDIDLSFTVSDATNLDRTLWDGTPGDWKRLDATDANPTNCVATDCNAGTLD